MTDQKTYCPAGCGNLYINKDFAIKHANEEHPGWNKVETVKRKGWVTPHGFGDFAIPVTYEEACTQTEALSKTLFTGKYIPRKEYNPFDRSKND